jgi:CHASE2 domain-containing sensor protein
MLRRRLGIEWCAIALLTVALVGAAVLTRATSRIDNAAYDLLVGLRAPPASDRIVIVAIDDASIAALGPWPWPRRVHARAVARIAAAKPAALAYDVLFPEPGADDALLADALRGAPAVLPVLFESPGRDGRALDVTLPAAPIAGAAALGHVALPHDDDGAARGALLVVDDGTRRWLHVVERAYRLAYGHPSPAFARGEVGVTVPYRPIAGGFRTVPFASIGALPPQFLRNRIVLVGATAGGLGDRHAVPTRGGGAIAGIEVQANLLSALIADRLVREAPLAVRLAAALLPSVLLLLGFWWLRPSRALVASVAMLAAMAALPVALLVWTGLWIPPAAGLLGLLLVYPLWGWRRLQTVDGAIGRELALFAREGMTAPAHSDSADGHAAQLSGSIAALRDLRRLIADTIDGVADPLVVTTLDDRVLLANAAATALLGELVGQGAPADLLADAEIARDGRRFSPRRTPLSGADGAQRGWIVLLAEITAIRAAEAEREQALEFLSHDMRAPQAAILTLLEGVADPARIAAHARRTLALAEDFVQLARLRDTRFAPEETDLADSLAEAIDAAWPQVRARGVRIVVATPEEPCCIDGERDALTRMFANLIDNAVKFSPAGGEVRCVIVPDDDGFTASVEDDGPGIAEERIAQLFGRFGPTVRRGAATAGLGLAFVRAAAERHGGSVTYEPGPHGARFVLRFASAAERGARE